MYDFKHLRQSRPGGFPDGFVRDRLEGRLTRLSFIRTGVLCFPLFRFGPLGYGLR